MRAKTGLIYLFLCFFWSGLVLAVPAWNANDIYNTGDRVSHQKVIYEAKWWTQGTEPPTGQWGVWTEIGPDSGDPDPDPDPDPNDPTPDQPATGPDELSCTTVYQTKDATAYTVKVKVSNSNSAYVWNGSYFSVWSIDFETTSQVNSVTSSNGAVSYTQSGGVLSIALGWQSHFDLNSSVEVTVQATRAGGHPFLENCRPRYVRGEDIRYPDYADLPASWEKGKQNLQAADLISNSSQYYQTAVTPVTDTMIMYHPANPTQLQIGLVDRVDHIVNLQDNVRMWVPNSYLAMGIGYANEQFKFNPNYLCALGTKENFTCGIIPFETQAPGLVVRVNGEPWIWPIVIGHPDGPFQVETGNFSDVIKHLPDFYPPTANHDDYTAVTEDPTHPGWISSPINAALSLTVTRETLNGVKGIDFNNFMDQAVDPWAEFSTVTYAYNRGINSFYGKKIFTDNRQQALSSTDIATDFDMGGYASHVPTIRAITRDMNKSTDIYDAQLEWTDVQGFFTELRTFFESGVPSTQEWNAMMSDVQRAHQVLAQHWGGSHVSYRYDFLTLLRVAKKHLPAPSNPRPTGEDWYYLVKNANP